MPSASGENGHGKTAIVIGASRGLGLGLAREFAARGWRVTTTARDPETAPELTHAADELGGALVVETVDMNRIESVDALAARLTGSSFDLVFVNAGVYGPQHQSVDAATPDEIGTLLFTNAIAPIRLARRLLPLVSDGGTVAFMSSHMGSVADNTSGGTDLYRASKAALNSLTRGFAATDVGGRNLTVLTMHPGWVRTAMGGDQAPLSVEESTRGLADVIEANHKPGHRFLDYQGNELAW
ncbi:MAG TPA: SDR family oxidoreductase [Bradyrhizobium sp.]|nr:SDR family oxidoreductase [Bradyrhizobium sp.]